MVRRFALVSVALACVSAGALQPADPTPPTPPAASPAPVETSVAQPATAPAGPRVLVATVNGTPVYLDEFVEPLLSRVIPAVFNEFALAHEPELAVAPAEIDRFLAVQLKGVPPAQIPPREQLDQIAKQYIQRHKFQIAVYKAFGGGRLLMQEQGPEAFDATKRLLEDAEAKGKFKIEDPALRTAFYRFWTTDHGPLLSSADPTDTQIKDFLSPIWSTPSSPPSPSTAPTSQP